MSSKVTNNRKKPIFLKKFCILVLLKSYNQQLEDKTANDNYFSLKFK